MGRLIKSQRHGATKKAQHMDIRFPFFKEISLKIGPVNSDGEDYPSSQLQKGLILISNGQELAEEGVGFGVPVLMKGLQTIFAGEIALTWVKEGSHQEIEAIYLMNLQERLSSRGGVINSSSIYRIKHILEELHRRFPLSRGLLTSFSRWLRENIGWKIVFEDAGCRHNIKINYTVDSATRTIAVIMNTSGEALEGVDEVILMNEQGAHYFDAYSDSSGLHLRGDQIGSWDPVTAERACFISSTHRLAFNLRQINGTNLFRGREFVGSHLAWAGFGYSIPPSRQEFTYTLGIERYP